MSRFFLIIALTVVALPASTLFLPSAAHAQSLSARAASLEKRHSLLLAHRDRLEKQLRAQTQRVSRLKRQPVSVARDLQLRGALRSAQSLANRLTRIQRQSRQVVKGLLEIYAAAIKTTDDEQRKTWTVRKKRLLEKTRRDAQPAKLVTQGKASPLDSPDDLDEKADLLADSAEKVRRQVKKLTRRIAAMKKKASLRRHRRAANDNPFVEDTTRRLGGKRARGSAVKTDSNDPSPGPAAPAPSTGGQSPPPNQTDLGGNRGNPSHDGTSGAPKNAFESSDRGVTSPGPLLRSLDPAALQKLLRGGKGPLKQRLKALQRAQKRLLSLQKKLDARADALRAAAKKAKASEIKKK